MKKMLSMLILLLVMMNAATAFASCKVEEDHRYGSWKTKTSATCTRQGHQFKYCTKCDHWEQRWTAKLPHTPGEMTVTKEPTCTETGKQESICQVCNNKVRYTIDKLPHKDGEMVVTKEPTCTASGIGEYTCADCGRVKKEKIAKLGHDMGEMVVTKEPTCTKTGTAEEACKRCEYVKTTKLNKTEHPWGEWIVTREPEGKRKGLRVSTCTTCTAKRENTFYWEGTLYKDMEPCEEVIRLQEMMRDLGLYKGNIRSGSYGEMTAESVAHFQRSVGLEETGVADKLTIGALQVAWEKATGKKVVDTLETEEMENADEAKAIEE